VGSLGSAARGSGEILDISNVMWRKASYSGANGGNCVEVTTAATQIAVRDSKDPHGAILTFAISDWRAFIDRAAHR
jgi:hypothetical protein